ncbi:MULTISPECIES: conjugal transfer transcriptional regulator TraJ [Enterobacteriaceae]|uniref:conjugal transfer transcriptional regulator TraJ n=1 Tax=Enterobacteriaceae TaxID=543 RepID=UPI000DE4BC0E|nr:conjugal transfer transcriptional regulator TraJ [Escherichia coli]EFK7628754.1 conjugal transfer transcriptional regulator TraJ [Escherichia coli]MCN7438626.1 conjugal transfer transcriptional regulator TraJ [Escherichia coli]RXB77523.1 conjugal transfer transcriptional regulator TraJ [Escherichia coli]HCA6688818.1 conjugal transfer transcriptional regulator TraJ [Escherichia coli]
MYPTDPRQLNTERQIYLDKQFFVDVFSIPACVRNTNGDFIGYNEKFSKEFIGSLDIKEWFYSLPVQVATSFLREELDAMSLPSSMNKIQSVAIGDKLWLVQFIPLIYGEVVNVLWLFFCKNSNVIVDYCRGLRTNITNDRMLEFKNKSTEIQWKVFILYLFGFCHESIASLLSITNGSSRNAISEVYKFFGIHSKHDLLMIFHTSRMHSLFFDELFFILKCAE